MRKWHWYNYSIHRPPPNLPIVPNPPSLSPSHFLPGWRSNARSLVAFRYHVSLFLFRWNSFSLFPWTILIVFFDRLWRVHIPHWVCPVLLWPCILTGKPQKWGWALFSTSHQGHMSQTFPPLVMWTLIICLVKVSARILKYKLTISSLMTNKEEILWGAIQRFWHHYLPLPSLSVHHCLYSYPLQWLSNADNWFPSFLLHVFINILW
jgi:hypothetical protein